MWDLLKSKVSNFISRITQEAKEEEVKTPVEERIKGVRITYFMHGTTTDDERGLVSGQAPGELSELGMRQLRELADKIRGKKFDAVFCSDLKRAVDSANIVFGSTYRIIQDKRLREVDYGALAGRSEREIIYRDHIDKPFLEGESLRDVERRVADFLNYLSKNYEGKHVAIVAHKAPQLAFEVLTKNKTWLEAISEDVGEKKVWYPSWEYFVEGEFKIEKGRVDEAEPVKQSSLREEGPESRRIMAEIKELPKPMPQQSPHISGIKIRVGVADHLKRMVLRKIKLSRERVNEIATELEFSLIQSDVHPDVAKEVCERIGERLLDKEYGSSDDLEREIRNVLRDIFMEEVFGKHEPFDLIERVRESSKPCKILFVGPNGAGKTTTIAKVSKMLMEEGFSVVISASDTFRAAAIEQTEEHGRRLGVRVIKHDYGGDAAAVAFDAIKHAEANKVDAVLIDSAGRQDTNYNLLRELEKINRVTKPDIKIFVGESLAGNSLYQQVKKFNEAIRLDGIILTKADCDAKGGTAISILRETGVPIIYLGVGQKYTDLQRFDPAFIMDKII